MSFITNHIANNSNYNNTDLSEIFPPFEILYYNLGQNNPNVTVQINLNKNKSSTTDYAVFPSIYYGWKGSSGTYNALETSSAVKSIVISEITTTSFKFNLQKSTGDNVNIFLIFLVIYSSTANYPKSY